MSKPEVLEKKPVGMYEVKEELKKIKKRDGELSFRGAKTDEYVTAFSHTKKKDADELFDKLVKLKVPLLKEQHLLKIVDLLPRTEAELKLILQGYSSMAPNKENLKKLMSAVKPYLPAKRS